MNTLNWKELNWKELSKLGLVEYANTQIFHPMGLALSWDTSTNNSHCAFVAEDAVFTYGTRNKPKQYWELMLDVALHCVELYPESKEWCENVSFWQSVCSFEKPPFVNVECDFSNITNVLTQDASEVESYSQRLQGVAITMRWKEAFKEYVSRGVKLTAAQSKMWIDIGGLLKLDEGDLIIDVNSEYHVQANSHDEYNGYSYKIPCLENYLENKVTYPLNIDLTSPVKPIVAETVVKDENGYYKHSQIPEFTEDGDYEYWLKSHGIEAEYFGFEENASEELLEKYYSFGNSDVSGWDVSNLSNKEGSFLIMIGDDQDGPIAVFAKPTLPHSCGSDEMEGCA